VRKQKKHAIVAELQEMLNDQPALVLVDYRGLSVHELSELRQTLTEVGGRLRVVKNTLFRHALGDQTSAALDQFLAGPVAVTFVEGEVVPVLKALTEFAAKHAALSLKGGWIDKACMEAARLEVLATIPPRDQLLAQLVATLIAPLRELVGVLQAVPRDLVLTLQALAQQKESQAGADA
jgi:large subunit ribosomal protein L10